MSTICAKAEIYREAMSRIFRADILEGPCAGRAFIVQHVRPSQIGSTLTVRFNPDDQFAEIVERPSEATREMLHDVLTRLVRESRAVPFKSGEGAQFFREVPKTLLDEAAALLGIEVRS